MEKENLILDLSFGFALEIIKFTEGLEQLKKYNLANQLFRSGTSIGANVREAQSAESKADFIHKVKIADKEANETEYWLLLCQHSESYPNCENLLEDVLVLKKIMSKIIGSAKS
ncbi:MAG: four helix bundle protein [Saprospiraceae bacterium]|nr:four helix bundle protein [Saprospiraceae bacterium]